MAVKDAPGSKGRFPVIVYIQGYGSSLHDNSGLCEYLASHGFIVIGSAFQNEKGRMIADRDTVYSDVRCLLEYARRIDGADLTHVGVIGHSGGAQTALVYASQPGAIVDAVVSLDTTQDYYYNTRPAFKSYVDRVDPSAQKVPLLIAATQCAVFDLADRLTKSDLLYVKADKLGHEEFTSEGVVAAALNHPESAAGVRQRFSAQCELIREFLDLHLNGVKRKGNWIAPPHFEVQHLAVGPSRPSRYVLGKIPPSPRQFRMIIERSPNEALEILDTFRRLVPKSIILESQLAFAIVDHFLDINEPKWALRFAAKYKQLIGKYAPSGRIYLQWRQIYQRNGATEEAVRNWKRALILDPGNKKALQLIYE